MSFMTGQKLLNRNTRTLQKLQIPVCRNLPKALQIYVVFRSFARRHDRKLPGYRLRKRSSSEMSHWVIEQYAEVLYSAALTLCLF